MRERNDAVDDKLSDARLPGFLVDFSPGEAEALGAFHEDALEPEEARESSADLLRKEQK
jgi:hypothetical protein